MSLPRSRPELPKTIYSWGSLWTPGGELTALLAAASPPPDALDPVLGERFLARLAQTLSLPGVVVGPQRRVLDQSIPEFFEARRAALPEDPWGFPGVYLVLGRRAATRWERSLSWETESALVSDRLNCGGLYRDTAAWLVLPPQRDDPRFSWSAEPAGLVRRKKESWGARAVCLGAFAPQEIQPRLLAFLPWSFGKPPSTGWVNVLTAVWAQHTGLKIQEVSPLNPSWDVFRTEWNWSFQATVKVADVEATRSLEVAVSGLQLAEWTPGEHGDGTPSIEDLRLWHRPALSLAVPAPSSSWKVRWKALWEALSASDLRLAWENVLLAQGETGMSGRLPLVLRAQFKPQVRHELDRSAANQAPENVSEERLRELAKTLVQACEDGRLVWSPHAQQWFERLILRPLEAEEHQELHKLSDPAVVVAFLKDDPPVLEETLRRLDPTDAALCLRAFPDQRWRRHVTAHREAELRREEEYCQALEQRKELSSSRVLDAWRCFHREWKRQKEKFQQEK